MRRVLAMTCALLLAACGGGEDRDDELSADEDRQLNDAAAMLDEPDVEESGSEENEAEED